MLSFSFNNSLLLDKTPPLIEELQEEVSKINGDLHKGYDSEYGCLHTVVDNDTINRVKEVVHQKLELNPEYVVVCGIGGSSLGTIAVADAVKGRLFNQITDGPKLLVSVQVDSDYTRDIISIIEPVLQRGGNIILNGVSKSGGTTETIATFEIFEALIKKYKDNYQDFIVLTSEPDSKFWKLGESRGYTLLPNYPSVGGRYSVFSPVGLFPFGMIGIDLDELLLGAREMRDACLKEDADALTGAALHYAHYRNGRNVHYLFLFAEDCEAIGKWYRQLIGESLGKEFNRQQEQVFEGITPSYAIGSTDMHSISQLFFGGPHDKYVTFVDIANFNKESVLPVDDDYEIMVPHVQGKPLKHIMDAIHQGTQITFEKDKRPFCVIDLPSKSEHSIGSLLMYLMMQTIYTSVLMNVNPFDQPNVEAYKKETKEILSKG